MLDRRTLFAFVWFCIVTGLYNLYLNELFFGSWESIQVRALYYSITAANLLYLTIEDMTGNQSPSQIQMNATNKLTLVVNFILFALSLTGVLNNPVLYLILFNGSIFVTTMIILSAAFKHGYFNLQDENE